MACLLPFRGRDPGLDRFSLLPAASHERGETGHEGYRV